MIRRTLSREYAFKFLYNLYANDTSLLDLSELDIKFELDKFHPTFAETDSEHTENKLNTQEISFAKTLIHLVIDNLNELLLHIKKFLKLDINRVSTVDLSILLLASSELIYNKKTPSKVVITEAINIAKKYGNNESFSLVNSILDKIRGELE